jgi:hypothetical protein
MALDGLFKRMDVPMAADTGIRFFTYKNLLLTLWARASLKAPPIDPGAETFAVSLSAFRDFYTELWTDQKGLRIIGDEKKADFLQWAAQASDQPSADLSDRLGTVFEALFDEIQRELAPVRTGNLDPPYSSFSGTFILIFAQTLNPQPTVRLFMQLIGILCSVGAALFWATAVIMFKKSGETFSPMALNLFKGVVTLVLLVPTLWIAGVPLFPVRPVTTGCCSAFPAF